MLVWVVGLCGVSVDMFGAMLVMHTPDVVSFPRIVRFHQQKKQILLGVVVSASAVADGSVQMRPCGRIGKLCVCVDPDFLLAVWHYCQAVCCLLHSFRWFLL